MAVTLQVQSVIYHNEKESLLRALNSLANAIRINRNTTKELGEVTVCYGDASKAPVYTDLEVDALSKQFADYFTFKYTFFNENTGSAKGHNRLGESCSSDYMMIMNPDVIVCPKLFTGMIAPLLDETLNVGMTEARQTPVEHPKEYDRKTLETDWAATACAIFSTALFRELNGFDHQTFFLYCDDVDFSWRVRLTGKKLMYRPDCPVFHAKRLSGAGTWQPTSAEIYYSQESSLLMAYKWSNMERFKKLYRIFEAANTPESEKVIKHFNELKKEGKLPQQLDPSHKVAKFVGDDYTEHRYKL